jgi:hypothetical protein
VRLTSEPETTLIEPALELPSKLIEQGGCSFTYLIVTVLNCVGDIKTEPPGPSELTIDEKFLIPIAGKYPDTV